MKKRRPVVAPQPGVALREPSKFVRRPTKTSTFTSKTPSRMGTNKSRSSKRTLRRTTEEEKRRKKDYYIDDDDVVTGLLTEEGTDTYGIEAAYTADSWGLAVAYADDETNTYWGINGTYAFDFATLSVGVESEDSGSATAEGFFVGLSFPEVGPGSFDIGMGTTDNFADGVSEYYIYEASYAYPVNDGMTITPGIYIREGETDQTGFAVKTSFSF